MSLPTPENLLPHRPPMLLLDRLLILEENSLVAEKQFRADEFFVQGHYPDYPLVPGVITCEALLQAGAALIAFKRKAQPSDGVPVVARLTQAKFRRPLRPGDTVRLHVTLVEELSAVYVLKGEAKIDGKVAASLEFTCTLAPRLP